MTVYVVTNTELDWDCVVGVYKKIEDARRIAVELGGDPEADYFPLLISEEPLE